jgi:hypothetical protein
LFLKATDLVRGQLAVVVWAHYLWLAFGNRAHKEFRKSDTGLKPKGHPACHPATNPHVPPVCGFGAQTARWRRLNAMAFEFRLKKMHFAHFEHCSRFRNPKFAHPRPPPRPSRSLQGIPKLHPRQGWRAPAGVSIGLQNCANAMVPGGPVRSKLAPKPAHPLVHFPRARGLI